MAYSISFPALKTAAYAFLLITAAAGGLMAQKDALPDGPGKDTTVRVCGACHGVEIATSRRETRDGWNAVVGEMVQRGAKGSDEEFGQVVDYLTEHFSKQAATAKVNVNTAAAKDLTSVLEISDKDASAIVQYREDKGKFKSFDDLAKVPGVDVSKLEAKKSSLEF